MLYVGSDTHTGSVGSVQQSHHGNVAVGAKAAILTRTVSNQLWHFIQIGNPGSFHQVLVTRSEKPERQIRLKLRACVTKTGSPVSLAPKGVENTGAPAWGAALRGAPR